jgi:hypothetical protein
MIEDITSFPHMPTEVPQLYQRWKRLHPDSSMQDFWSWFQVTSGYNITAIMTDDEVEWTLRQLADDRALAEAMFEGMGGGP